MKKTIWMAPMALAIAATLGSAALTTSPAKAQSGSTSEVRVRINLTGAVVNGVRSEGNAEYRSSATYRSLKVQADKVNLANGTTLAVAVNGSTFGRITLAFGRGELQRSTKDGQAVPVIKAGDIITVTAATGGLVLQGKF